MMHNKSGAIDRLAIVRLPFHKNLTVAGKLKVTGWLAGKAGCENTVEIFISLGEMKKKAVSGLKRYKTAFENKNYRLRNSGFEAVIDVKGMKNGSYDLTVTGRFNDEIVDIKYPEKIFVTDNLLIKSINAAVLFGTKAVKKAARHIGGYIREPFFVFSLIKNVFAIIALKVKRKDFIIISLTEHMGDIAACEPVIGILTEKYPGMPLVWVVNYRYEQLLRHDARLSAVIKVTSIFEWSILKKIFRALKVMDLHIDKKPCPKFFINLDNPNKSGVTLDNYCHKGTLLEIMLLSAGLPKMDLQPSFHFEPGKRLDVPEKTVVLHCTANEMQRNWEDKKWEELAAFIISNGYNVAEIGFKNRVRTINGPAYLNFCGKLSLQEYALLIKKSVLFIGIDSGFAHIANAVRTKGIVLQGHYRDFEKYMPYSGGYKNGEIGDIIQYEGYAADIPVEMVLKKIKERLGK